MFRSRIIVRITILKELLTILLTLLTKSPDHPSGAEGLQASGKSKRGSVMWGSFRN